MSTQGRVAGNRYEAPGGEFSAPVPAWCTRVEDTVTRDPVTRRSLVQVGFVDDSGHWNGIECVPVPDAPPDARPSPDEVRAKLSEWFERTMIPLKRESFPGLTLVSSEELALRDGSHGWFGLVNIPEGSHVVDSKTERARGFWGLAGGVASWQQKRRDTMRAFLCSFHGSCVILSSAARDERELEGGETPEERVRRMSEPQQVQLLKEELLGIQASIEVPSEPARSP